jgi:hypothetical protein
MAGLGFSPIIAELVSPSRRRSGSAAILRCRIWPDKKLVRLNFKISAWAVPNKLGWTPKRVAGSVWSGWNPRQTVPQFYF